MPARNIQKSEISDRAHRRAEHEPGETADEDADVGTALGSDDAVEEQQHHEAFAQHRDADDPERT